MIVGLLYPSKDWEQVKRYEEDKTIVRDLNLDILFRTSAQSVVWKDDDVEMISAVDPFIEQTMRQVMMVPILTKEEIDYRQKVIKDFLEYPELARKLYELSTRLDAEWNVLGRRGKKQQDQEVSGELFTKIRVVQMMVKYLTEVKEILAEYQGKVQSEGVRNFIQRVCDEFSPEREKHMRKLLEDLSFFVTDEVKEKQMLEGRILVPRFELGCRIGESLRFADYKLQDVKSISKKFHKRGGLISQVEDLRVKAQSDSLLMTKNPKMEEQSANMEKIIITYLCGSLQPFLLSMSSFFDQLRLQTAFMIGAFQVTDHMRRYEEEMFFPTVGSQNSIRFEDLKELVLCLEQHRNPVGNTTDIRNKNLMVVTGANQGGKSTFLRSIGIAQIMMQCGMPVLAQRYESGLYPGFFTHFTRREDSEMNSGRLDEELRRMSQIVDHIRENEEKNPGSSMVLLNESFATTTEKEGSVIAYDIIRAMTELGVNVLTVTHLLSFAKKLYEEKEEEKKASANGETNVVFLSAERLENGNRTYKMIETVPQLTSFGLDLYDTMVLHKKTEE